ncbi:MAG: Thoeris anti-defense Tad2 family protein [Culicoidibacterales bacterium]
MKFELALKALKEGETVSRRCWCADKKVYIVDSEIVVFLYGYSRPFLTSDDVMANDWEIVEQVEIKRVSNGNEMFGRQKIERRRQIEALH